MHESIYIFFFSFASFSAFRKSNMRGVGGLGGSVLNSACYLVLLFPKGCGLRYGWGAVRGPPWPGQAATASKPVHQITKTTKRIENRLVRFGVEMRYAIFHFSLFLSFLLNDTYLFVYEKCDNNRELKENTDLQHTTRGFCSYLALRVYNRFFSHR